MTQTIREHRWFSDEVTAKLHNQRMDNGLPYHVAPFSTLVACMGNHWRPGCVEAVMEMCQHTFEAGYQVVFYEQQDLCIRPLEGIGTMRNEALRKARREGFEYILYVDNDVMPPKDALVRLLHRLMPIVIPLPRYADGESHGVTAADPEKTPEGRGLALITSTVISMALFNMRVFGAFDAFWEDTIGAHEQYHFEKLYDMTGQRPFLDTDVPVTIVEPPHYPLDNRGEAAPENVTPIRKAKIWMP